jgi:hypothetical protein
MVRLPCLPRLRFSNSQYGLGTLRLFTYEFDRLGAPAFVDMDEVLFGGREEHRDFLRPHGFIAGAGVGNRL